MTRETSPGWGRLHDIARASKSDGSEPCPWCGKPIEWGAQIVRHNIETPEGIAPLAVLHITCSADQVEHEENFGGGYRGCQGADDGDDGGWA